MEPEITPTVHGMRRFSSDDQLVESFPAAVEVRAIVESQIMAKRCHALSLGYQITPQSRVLATGGAAVNPAIRQVRIYHHSLRYLWQAMTVVCLVTVLVPWLVWSNPPIRLLNSR